MRFTIAGASGLIPGAPGDRFGLRAAEVWRELCDEHVPRRSGALRASARALPWRIEYTAPYAGHLYRGARGRPGRPWDREADPAKLSTILQREVEGGLKVYDS